MIARALYRLLAVGVCVVVSATGCAFQGVNSLPLPGAVGRGPGAAVYHVQIANVATLESNSPVMMNDVVVGSVGKMDAQDWHAIVDISVQPDVVIPANVVASVGQTSLLGSMHLALNTPLGQKPEGRLAPGATIGLNESSTYPTTEQTLSSLSVVVNAGGLGQIGEIVHTFNQALSGREADFRDLLTQLDAFVGTLDQQRQSLVGTLEAMNTIASNFAGRRDVIDQALQRIPRALEVLDRKRPQLTTALTKLGEFSQTANRLVNDTQADLVKNLQNLQPTIAALADVGPDLDAGLAYATVFPYGQNLIDRAVRGDYINLFATVDLSGPRLRKSIFLGTRGGQEGRDLVPLPGEPYFQRYTYDPRGSPDRTAASRRTVVAAARDAPDGRTAGRSARGGGKPARPGFASRASSDATSAADDHRSGVARSAAAERYGVHHDRSCPDRRRTDLRRAVRADRWR